MYPYLLMYVSVNVLCSSIVECGSLCITYNVPTLIPLGFLRALTQTSHSVTNSGEANNRTRKARSQRARHECSRVRIQTNIFSMRTLFCLLVLNMKTGPGVKAVFNILLLVVTSVSNAAEFRGGKIQI